MSDKDNKNSLPPEDDHEDFDFDPSEVTDAGETDEAQKAEAQAKQTKINLQHRAASADALRLESYGENNLVKRAKKLAGVNGFNFVHFKPAPGELGKMGIQIANPQSELNRLAVMDGLFDFGSGKVPFPHRDTFRGRLVDHTGETLSPKAPASVELISAVNAAGLENPSARAVAESYVIWANQHKQDGLLAKFFARMPEWDGTPRMESYLIELFKPKDTALNRLVGHYFWLSLFNRITRPGCPAPLSIVLIGAQGAGKSMFSRITCETLMDDPNVAPIPLDWTTKDFNKFLRAITGQSIIANVAEMGGLKKADIERMKDFATRDKDELDFKFEDTMIKPRQWIIITDGNSYEGLQRDDTGNRRFYPIFLAQEEDREGQPAWAEEFEVDYLHYKKDVWQLMAEAKAWMEANTYSGYLDIIHKVTAEVQKFSRDEMKNDRGTLVEAPIEYFLGEVLVRAEYDIHPKGFYVSYGNIMEGFMNLSRTHMPNARGLKRHMEKLNYEKIMFNASKGYLLPCLLKDGTESTDLNEVLGDKFVNDQGLTLEQKKKIIIEARKRAQNKNDSGGGF